jgi:hypothetical protein
MAPTVPGDSGLIQEIQESRQDAPAVPSASKMPAHYMKTHAEWRST